MAATAWYLSLLSMILFAEASRAGLKEVRVTADAQS